MTRRTIRLALAGVAALVPLTACAAQNAGGGAATAADPVYQERVARYLADPGNFQYSPMEPVGGAAAFTPMAEGAGSPISPEALEKARDYAVRSNATAYLVWYRGKIVSRYYAEGVGPDTPLVSKSLSKPLSAIAVGRAIELGYIKSLDQKLGDIIPELAGKPKGEILVRHLLDMRSGLIDQDFNMEPNSVWNLAYLSPDHGIYIRDEYPLIDQPGSRYAYSNAVGDFVALVVEAASGRRWAEFLGNEILKPIGAVGGEIWVSKPGGLAHSGCCMTMPAESYLRLAVLLDKDGMWNGKRLLPPGYVAEMRKGTPQNPNYGLGLWLGEPYREYRGFGAEGAPGPKIYQSEPFLDPGTFLFDGNGSQTVHVSPGNDLVVLRMGPNPPKDLNWDNAYLPNTLIRGIE